jgi:hypothetical protein
MSGNYDEGDIKKEFNRLERNYERRVSINGVL